MTQSGPFRAEIHCPIDQVVVAVFLPRSLSDFGADGDGGGPGGSGLVSYLQCDIVDVVKDLDVAVLKIVDHH